MSARVSTPFHFNIHILMSVTALSRSWHRFFFYKLQNTDKMRKVAKTKTRERKKATRKEKGL